MTKKVAERLASRYKAARIFQKLDYLTYLVTTDPEQLTSPAGYLRRAIEDAYAAPPGYTKDWEEQIKAEAEEKQAAEDRWRAVEEHQRAEEERQAQLNEKRTKKAEALREQYQTGETEEGLWSAIMEQAKALDKTGALYLLSSFLVSCRDSKAIVAVPNANNLGHIKHRYTTLIHRMITSRMKWKKVEVEYIVLAE